ncbi:MAG TPA: hypothetical protein PKK23_19625 [Nitrospirales bacterium]|nr:hypothetical protein [Nitrospirales bacterium]
MSTAKGRPDWALARRSVLQRVDAKPLSAIVAPSAKGARRRQGTPLAVFFNTPSICESERSYYAHPP